MQYCDQGICQLGVKLFADESFMLGVAKAVELCARDVRHLKRRAHMRQISYAQHYASFRKFPI